MEDLLGQLKRDTDAVRMTVDEKSAMRSRVSEYMTMRPVVERPAKVRRTFLFSKPMQFASASLCLLLAGGSVSYAAESTLPGDALYPVKVHVNEEVRAVLAVDDEAKAQWETVRAERRLDEARKLIETHAATSEQVDALEQRFAEHEQRVEETITKVEEQKGPEAAARISAHLETSLDAHSRILENLSRKQEKRTKKDEEGEETKSSIAPDVDIEQMVEQERADKARSEGAGKFADRVRKAGERAKEMRVRAEGRARSGHSSDRGGSSSKEE